MRDRAHDEPRFGDLLRAHRRRAGLTQDELGDLSAISSRAIRDIEAGKAYGRPQTITLLADGLGLEGLTRETFLDASRNIPDDRTGAMAAVDAAPPAAVDGLVGRDAEVRAMVHALESGCHRVVSVCGLGGVGKTRTVQDVARRIHSERRWPVIWVPASPTAPLTASGPLAREIQELLASGTRAVTRISRVIRRHDTLLVLDGVTDLAAPASETVQQLLARCPKLRVIATSRAALPIPGAHPTMVPPLPTPPVNGGPPSLTALAGIPSVRLLVERVAETQPGWGLTTQDAPAVAGLCRRLDGLPLALELAAHQTTVLSIQELADRPDKDLLALARPAPNGRPATIGGLIDDSYRLLTEDDRAHLHTLVDLDTPWTIDDAATVLGRTGTETVDALVVLTRVGLIRRQQDQDTTQFEVLNLVRAYLAGLARWSGVTPGSGVTRWSGVAR